MITPKNYKPSRTIKVEFIKKVKVSYKKVVDEERYKFTAIFDEFSYYISDYFDSLDACVSYSHATVDEANKPDSESPVSNLVTLATQLIETMEVDNDIDGATYCYDISALNEVIKDYVRREKRMNND